MFEKACPEEKILVSWGTIQTQHVASDSFPRTGSVFLGGFWHTQVPVIHQVNFTFFSARNALFPWETIQTQHVASDSFSGTGEWFLSLGGGVVVESDPETHLPETLVSCGTMSFWRKFCY